MTEEPLLMLREVAEALALPESTVRYYRDIFLDHIPTIGTGRRRRYPPPAVAVLRTIADGYAAGRSRAAILGMLDGAPQHAGPGPTGQPGAAARPRDAVSNLELLAAIVDGEREQRDALWQMAREIVRLTDVLDGQERVLTEIADHAGVRPALAAGQAPKALAGGRTIAADRAEVHAPPFAPPAFLDGQPGAARGFADGPPARAEREAVPSAAAPPASVPGPALSEMERLRGELESERQLVERLREAKVRLENRISHAEAALEESRPRRRTSMLGRLFSTGEE
jgi:DNA-binding transcriptional MerR regulator